MKHQRLYTLGLFFSLILLFAACVAPGGAPAPAAGGEGAAAAETASGGDAKPYIPIISKGFQHQFWQAVKSGAEQAAAEFDVDITFEGPETEAMVDKQIEMLQTALDKNPSAICLAALDSKAVVP
ncbi:MAG: substrate-binding domain-containing protein, partial [Caldilineaceae bacterium]|nr:substrate-binding domain-containing protein [Caldilineaceae bacterium]